MRPNDAEQMANSVYRDQAAPLGLSQRAAIAKSSSNNTVLEYEQSK